MAQNPSSAAKAHEFLVVQLSFAEALRIHASLGSQQALDELLLAHFQREKRDGNIVVECGVLSDVEHEGGLSHRGTGGDDDEIGRLETCRKVVEVLEPTPDARNRTASTLDLLDPLHRRPEELLDAHEAFRPATLIDLEDLVLGFIQQLGGWRGGLEGLRNNRCGNFDQASSERLLANDLGVVLDVCRGGNRVDEKSDVILAAARLEGPSALQLLGERERIYYITALRQRDHRAKDSPVALAIEHRVIEEFRRAQNCVGIHEHRRQHRLLRVFGVRWPSILVGVTNGRRYREFYGRA